MAEKLNNKKIILYGPPVHYVVTTLFFNLSPLFDKETPLIRFLLFGLLSIYITWLMAQWVIQKIHILYSGLDNYQKRIKVLILLSLPSVIILVGFRIFCLKYWVFAGAGNFELLADDVLFMLGINLFHLVIIFSIYESRYFFRKWLQSKRQAEELLRSNLEIQLNSLKSQVQPHFLFNSLNTLQALVKTEENKKAMDFIGDLSQVYRYLLQSSENPLIPLEKEMAFTHAYFNLLKTRFGEGLQLQIDINPAYRQYLIPPVTLQLLVENAVKHNIASVNKPLTIQIYSNGHDSLVTRNNLQRKPESAVISSKKGLLNISTKYHLLNQPDILINETDGAFEVQVPLINPATHESFDH